MRCLTTLLLVAGRTARSTRQNEYGVVCVRVCDVRTYATRRPTVQAITNTAPISYRACACACPKHEASLYLTRTHTLTHLQAYTHSYTDTSYVTMMSSRREKCRQPEKHRIRRPFPHRQHQVRKISFTKRTYYYVVRLYERSTLDHVVSGMWHTQDIR